MSQNPWIIELGAFNLISGNIYLFSSLSFPKAHHFIILANESEIAFEGIGQPLNLTFILSIPASPYSLISLSQIGKSLNFTIILGKHVN